MQLTGIIETPAWAVYGQQTIRKSNPKKPGPSIVVFPNPATLNPDFEAKIW